MSLHSAWRNGTGMCHRGQFVGADWTRSEAAKHILLDGVRRRRGSVLNMAYTSRWSTFRSLSSDGPVLDPRKGDVGALFQRKRPEAKWGKAKYRLERTVDVSPDTVTSCGFTPSVQLQH